MRPDDIDGFETYLENRQVVERSPDTGQARSLFRRSQSKFENMEKLGITDETATDYFENVYESIKMLLQSFMALDGYKPYNHESVVAYMVEELEIGGVEANKLNVFRKLRNDISYRGDSATIDEAEEIRDLYQELRQELEPVFEKRVG